jgi:heptose-I-phosphate ethanolaminephosphotransferase
MPSHYELGETWWGTALVVLAVAIFRGALFAAQNVAQLPHGRRMAAGFAVLCLTLSLLAYASDERYTLAQPVTDFGLLYVAFFSAIALAPVAVALGRAVLAVLVIPLGIVTVVQALHAHVFGAPLDAEGWRTVMQSNVGEALEFSERYLTVDVMAGAAIALAVITGAALASVPVKLPRAAVVWGGVYALAAIAILGSNATLFAARTEGLTQALAYAAEVAEYRMVRKARASRPADLAVTQEPALASQPQTYVFLVGESLTRNHMSIYGYWRDTTPALERLADEMVMFTDVVSPHSYTEESLELVLALANQANGMRFGDRANYSLLEILRAAGFSTWWISNQNSFGPFDNKVAVLAREAEHVHFSGYRSGRFFANPPDEVLLEPFAAALRDPAPRKAIFLHFMGSHWVYARRYPPDAIVWSADPAAAQIGALAATHPKLHLLNDYDNAVRYHDGLVGQIIESLRASGQAAVAALFSDHGENVSRMKGHHRHEFTRDHVEVPLLLWFSPQYAALAPEVVARARENARLPFALEDLPHLVASLAKLRSSSLAPERSPLSPAYRAPRERHVFERQLRYEEADDPALNARRSLERAAGVHPKLRLSLWAHRVNTLAKMMEVAPLFGGAEIDVVYDAHARALAVNHPPDPPSGLLLDTLLAYAHRLNPKLGLWLDVKNLDEDNAARILAELEKLDARYAIRGRALVETEHTGKAAAALRQAGFRSSYYLPTAVVTARAPGSGEALGCDEAKAIERVVDSRRFAAISYNWGGRHWVERCLGRFVHARSLPTYAWDLEPVLGDGRVERVLDTQRLQAYAAMEAVLLPFKSPYDDRR